MIKWLNSPALSHDSLSHQVETVGTVYPHLYQRMVEWCRETLPATDWSAFLNSHTSYRRVNGPHHCTRFCFRHEEQRVMFVLAWSGDVTP